MFLRRLPEVRLAVAPESLRWRGGMFLSGLERLPLLLEGPRDPLGGCAGLDTPDLRATLHPSRIDQAEILSLTSSEPKRRSCCRLSQAVCAHR